jgi:O-antigen ligase
MGYNAYFAPQWMFTNNRLNFGIGSVDFAESNFLAAHMVMMLPITGVIFIKSKLVGKLLCMVNAVLTLNTLVLLRSRGSFLAAIMAFVIAIFLAEKKYRLLIISGAVLTGIVFFSLTDTFFWNRIATIEAEGQQRDASARGRLALWGIAWQMAKDHPLGIGADNFKKYVGQYDPDRKGRDTHSTYFRCLAETGFQGLFILLFLIYNSFKTLFRIRKDTSEDDDHIKIRLYAYGLTIANVAYLVAGIFISMIYIEEFYWMLLMPVFLKRAQLIADARQNTAEQVT